MVTAMTDERDDFWGLQKVRARLKAGAEGSGATLNAAECDFVLRKLPKPTGRPMLEHEAIAPLVEFCAELEKTEPLKSAVAKTAEHFHCSVSKVRAMRKGFRSNK